jgi:hypothetical protein
MCHASNLTKSFTHSLAIEFVLYTGASVRAKLEIAASLFLRTLTSSCCNFPLSRTTAGRYAGWLMGWLRVEV